VSVHSACLSLQLGKLCIRVCLKRLWPQTTLPAQCIRYIVKCRENSELIIINNKKCTLHPPTVTEKQIHASHATRSLILRTKNALLFGRDYAEQFKQADLGSPAFKRSTARCCSNSRAACVAPSATAVPVWLALFIWSTSTVNLMASTAAFVRK